MEVLDVTFGGEETKRPDKQYSENEFGDEGEGKVG